MLRQKIKLPQYDDWEVFAYYAVTTYHIDEIMERLWSIGIESNNARQAFENLSSGKLDTGLCYSNYSSRKSVIVVALTSSAEEFFNSLSHEIAHACVHISCATGIDLTSEDFTYLVGDLSMKAYPKVKELLCECCRRQVA